MQTLTCTNCGAAGSPADAFCTRCGMPRAGGPAPHGRGGSGSRVGMWIAVAAVGGLGAVVVLGILAAIAIPRFANVSRAAKEAEAVPILKQLHVLESRHQAQNGRFTANLSDRTAPDLLGTWADPGARYFTFSVSRATADELCIEATPSELGRSEGVRPTSMDAAGTQYAGPGCTGSIAGQGERERVVLDRSTDAGPALREIHRLETEYRKRNGTFADELEDPDAEGYLTGWDRRKSVYFEYRVFWMTETELCVDAEPTSAGRAAGLAGSSVDQAGTQYPGLGCSGTAMNRAPGAAPEDEPGQESAGDGER